MATYKIFRNFGLVGSEEYEIIEAETDEIADYMAEEFAMERVEWWFKKIDDDCEE